MVDREQTVTGELKIFSMFGRAFGLWISNLLPLGALMAIISIPSVFASTYFVSFDANNIDSLNFGVVGIVYFFMLLFGAYLMAIIFNHITTQMRGGDVDLPTTLRQSLASIIPLAVVMILSTLLITFGTILLIVPGIILGLMFCVTWPVCVIERPGIFASFGRSRRLTKGNRWRIFGFFILLFLSYLPFGFAMQLILVPMAQTAAATGGAPEFPIWTTLLFGVLSMIVGLFYYILATVLYHDLRVLDEAREAQPVRTAIA